MPFAGEQRANDRDFLFQPQRHSTGRWRKEISIGPVAHPNAANILLHSVSQKALHSLADADYPARGTIDVDGSSAPPLGSHSATEACVEHIQAVQCNDKWNIQMPR